MALNDSTSRFAAVLLEALPEFPGQLTEWPLDNLHSQTEENGPMSHTVSRRRRYPPRTRRAIPRVEQLEDRSLLSGFSLTPVAILGNPAPGPEGGTFTFDFEAGGLNNKGQVAFTADLDQGAGDAGEGVFLGGKGGLSQIIRVGEPAPGGGTFGGFGSFSPDAINDSGDVAFGFGLDPLTLPLGVNAGVYRSAHGSGTVTAVLVPGVTPVPGGSGGETFAGTLFHPGLNNGGDLVFPGIVPATVGPGAPIGLGVGIFRADAQGHLTKVVRPGDAAPGGSTFDFAQNPAINNRGDVAFGAHVAADPCIDLGQTPPVFIFCAESVYVRDAATGAIRSIAHQGGAIPASAGGGTFDYAYGPVINSRGQILFDAGLRGTTGPIGQDSQALFLYSDGGLTPIVRPGDALPGGGHLLSASILVGNYDLSNNGDVAFSALLDTGEEGVYVWSHGSLTLVAKTGTVVPGVGTVAGMDQAGRGVPSSFVDLNDRGQVAFGVALTNGGGALLLATPGGNGPRDALAGSLAGATPADVTTVAAADLSTVAASLVPGGPSTSRHSGASATSPPANGGPQSGPGTAVILPQQATTSLATAPSSGAKTSHTSAVDGVFGPFLEGLWDDPLT
jgi:hypothetical protein